MKNVTILRLLTAVASGLSTLAALDLAGIAQMFDPTTAKYLVKAAVIDSFTSTPLTIERISGNSEGAITGWAFTNHPMPAVNSLPRVASSVQTPIPDTY